MLFYYFMIGTFGYFDVLHLFGEATEVT